MHINYTFNDHACQITKLASPRFENVNTCNNAIYNNTKNLARFMLYTQRDLQKWSMTMRQINITTSIVLLIATALAITGGVKGGVFEAVTALVTVGLSAAVLLWWHWCAKAKRSFSN